MALAATYGFTADQGATFNQVIIWRDSTNTPVDLTGYVARMQVRKSTTGNGLITTLTTENGGISVDPLTGTLTINISASDTAALPAGKHLYDLELETDGGEVNRLLMGYFVVRTEVTR